MRRGRLPLLAGICAGICLALVGCASGQATVATRPTPTSVPTATPMPTSGTWHTAAMLPPKGVDLEFAPSAPQTGYYCVSDTLPTTSSKWLYRSDDGGMTWRQLGGIAIPSVIAPGRFSCTVLVDAQDPYDVFVEIMIPTGCAGPGPCQGENVKMLWRSRNGGASWSQPNLPQATGMTTGTLSHLIVSGSRLIGLEGDYLQTPPECATDPHAIAALHVNDLVASDDNGQTWHTIGQSIYDQGLSISKVSGRSGGQLLQNMGSAIVVHAACTAFSSTGSSSRDSDWISRDDGATWTQVPINGGSDMESFMFTLAESSAPSNAHYGVAVDYGSGFTALPIVRYSADGGASWRSLPSLAAMPGAQTPGAQVNVYWVLAMPDGSVLVSVHVGTLGANGQSLSSAVYAIAPQSANPTWRQFTPSGISNNITVVGGSMPLSKTVQGWVLWGFSYDRQTNVYTYSYLTPLP
jgi:hypothetical protein